MVQLGLHAAYTLAENGTTSVIVLEAQDRIGGRINSFATNGDWIELGAQWIHGQGKNPLWKFVQKNKVLIRLLQSNICCCKICGLYYKHIMVINFDSSVINKFGASLTVANVIKLFYGHNYVAIGVTQPES